MSAPQRHCLDHPRDTLTGLAAVDRSALALYCLNGCRHELANRIRTKKHRVIGFLKMVSLKPLIPHGKIDTDHERCQT
jgi:hypothetical protein